MAKLKKELEKANKSLKAKLAGSVALLIAVVVVGAGGVALADSHVFNWLSVEQNVADQIAASVVGEQTNKTLGAVTSVYLPGPDFAVGKDQKFSVSAALADATSTFAFVSPFRAATTSASEVVVEDLGRSGLTVPTTTVELTRISFTSSTATGFNVGCGSSSSKFTTSTNSVAILTSDAVPATWKGVVENGLSTGAGAEVGGGSVTKISIGPSHPYIVCRIYSSVGGEFNNADGVSPGDIAIRFSRVQ